MGKSPRQPQHAASLPYLGTHINHLTVAPCPPPLAHYPPPTLATPPSPPPPCSTARGLQYLDIHSNNLVGSLPTALGSLPYLTYLNVGGNELSCCEGSTPSDTPNGGLPYWLIWSPLAISLTVYEQHWVGRFTGDFQVTLGCQPLWFTKHAHSKALYSSCVLLGSFARVPCAALHGAGRLEVTPVAQSLYLFQTTSDFSGIALEQTMDLITVRCNLTARPVGNASLWTTPDGLQLEPLPQTWVLNPSYTNYSTCFCYPVRRVVWWGGWVGVHVWMGHFGWCVHCPRPGSSAPLAHG